MDGIETKLAAARSRLILDKPFLGALALRLPMISAGKWCITAATDAKSFYYNPQYIEGLTLEQTEFVLAHEALHCALSHFARRQHRVKFRWDIACDHAINPLLVEDGLKAPPGTLILDCFRGMTAEEIYPSIDENSSDEPMDQHIYDGGGEGEEESDGGGGAPRPEPLSEKEKEELSAQWLQRLASAAQAAEQAGKLGGLIGRMVGDFLRPKLPWRALLARFLSLHARDDYSYMRPSRREGGMILPTLKSGECDIVVAIDTSGSITEAELEEFASEINAIKGQIRARITLLACDSELRGPWEFEPWEEFNFPPDLKGGGGTDFRPVFDWITEKGFSPASLLYFTDAQGDFPETMPNFHVLWLVKGKAQVPWGERIQLN